MAQKDRFVLTAVLLAEADDGRLWCGVQPRAHASNDRGDN